MPVRWCAMKLIASLLFAFTLSAADPTLADVLNSFQYRNLGPFRAGGWVSTIAVHHKLIYAGARTGGVWKSANAGTTFENVTDTIGIASVGALAIAPSNPEVVWLGSGDNSVTRSAYYGNGVYKTTNGGQTWQ